MLDVVDRFIGRYDPDPPGSGSSQFSAQSVIKQMASLSESLGTIKGRHKALVFVSAVFIVRSGGRRMHRRHQQCAAIAVQSDVSIYVVDPTGLNTSPPIEGRDQQSEQYLRPGRSVARGSSE